MCKIEKVCMCVCVVFFFFGCKIDRNYTFTDAVALIIDGKQEGRKTV